ncbi:MAG: O-antigen translocase [Sediminibacterium sp.]|uniref:O-antigen translocase n=1 Tax=Sediminibacterium sp. TaxID=1917865 RepID=UPI002AB8D247|nr:O-antigen translocase [Sediminibacterium sp.]MDZ4070739.1 O-antigen translocase [Sediminibacterium sp.]
MRGFIFKLKKNQLLKVTGLNAVSTSIGYLSSLIINKIIAVFIGPSGLALLSQFQNFLSISNIISTGGIQQGIVKYVAEYKVDLSNRDKIISNSYAITIICSVLSSLLGLLFAGQLSLMLFDSLAYKNIISLLSITFIFFGFNSLVLSILNGLEEYKKLVLLNICTSILNLVLSSFLVYFYGLYGSIIAIIVLQLIMSVITFILSKSLLKHKKLFKINFQFKECKKLFGFTLMVLFSTISMSLLQIFIRNYIIYENSIIEAGYFDGINKISTAYLGIITTTLSVYFLPKLSSLNNNVEVRVEVKRGFFYIIPSLIFITVIIYFFRTNIILAIYSIKFIKMENLFLYQLIGDIFKISSWLLGFVILSKAKIKMYIVTQLFYLLLSIILNMLLINNFGVIGSVYSHLLSYALLFFFILSILLKCRLI